MVILVVFIEASIMKVVIINNLFGVIADWALSNGNGVFFRVEDERW